MIAHNLALSIKQFSDSFWCNLGGDQPENACVGVFNEVIDMLPWIEKNTGPWRNASLFQRLKGMFDGDDLSAGSDFRSHIFRNQRRPRRYNNNFFVMHIALPHPAFNLRLVFKDVLQDLRIWNAIASLNA